MAQQTHFSTTAYAYAQSLLDVANERKVAEEIAGELEAIQGIINNDPLFKQFLSDPAIGNDARNGLLQRVFQGRVSPLLWNFLHVLSQREALPLFAEITGAYAKLFEQQLGKVEVDLTVAQQLGNTELENVRQRISSALKRDAILHQYVDDSIIGGMVLRVGDTMIDGSVKSQLQSLRHRMLAADVK
ncbi:MAG TPA: ATP synthase F1 subunit delta [Lacipirellulaceae bacterium]|jgi:F-type H+-transporting ATPase subunit delta|nr:ATP synthase F1 subunit delta [Lacipirellulaceae bacterium]